MAKRVPMTHNRALETIITQAGKYLAIITKMSPKIAKTTIFDNFGYNFCHKGCTKKGPENGPLEKYTPIYAANDL